MTVVIQSCMLTHSNEMENMASTFFFHAATLWQCQPEHDGMLMLALGSKQLLAGL